MIKKTIIVVFAVLLSIPLMGQEEESKLDTIFLLGRRKLIVEVRNISSGSVMYYDAEKDKMEKVARKDIQKILFSNGRIEVFNSPLLMTIDAGDWKTVIVTDRKKDVEGMYALGTVKGQSSAGSRSAKSAKKSATIRMQKRAANMGGMIVLITKEESIGGFGEPPSYRVEGVAYSYTPPPKKEEEEQEN